MSYAVLDLAQPVIENAGYVNQAIELWSRAETENRLLRYSSAPTQEAGLDVNRRDVSRLISDVKDARRLSISFHFRFAEERLDTKALDDVLRLGRYPKTQRFNGHKLLLVGFADAIGSYSANKTLSEKRAASVRDAILKTGAGIDPKAIVTRGYSELLPVACNTSDLGREKNRRVEVYLIER